MRVHKLALLASFAFLFVAPALGAETPDHFHACIDAGTDGTSKIVVSGTVYEDGCETKSLVRSEPQGINPKILMLQVHSEPVKGVCPHHVAPKDLKYEEPAQKGAFTQVHIQMDDTADVTSVEDSCS